ncbi:MAG: 4-hydroxythreonine-4-phosphate dehydrogenase PdxA, partial [Pseudomonadota bacterium]
IAVAGLNPHAGEGGKIGTEEREVILPAIKKLPNIVQHELTLFERTERLTESLVQAHGASGLPLSLAVPIDVTGRLRALSQKMLKEALLIGLEYEAEDNRDTLVETVSMFENTLKALLGELQGFSLPIPPGAIPIKLREVQIAWASVKPQIDQIVAAGPVTPEGLLTLSRGSDRLLALTQDVMDLYKVEADNLS